VASPAPLPSQDLTDRLLVGRYRLVRRLATGGMAQVWEGTDEVLARPVAVKVLHPHLAADRSFVERFRAEAVAAARLSHPSIVSIFDTCSDDGVEAIVMELVRGTTLRERLDRSGPLPAHEAIDVIGQVADALEVAHRKGVVHRDVKPANILLCQDGRVMVADFGIAKAVDIDIRDLTETGAMLGTAKYLSPEQVAGEPVTPRSDVYSLGVVLYEVLTGRPPFDADSEVATALARLHRNPLPPRSVRAGVPRRLEAVVLRAMAREPSARYAGAGDLRAALLAADPGRDGDLTAWSAPEPHTPPAGAPSFRQTERRWLLPVVVVVVLAVALGVAGVLFSRTDTGQELLGRTTDDTAADPGPGTQPPPQPAIAEVTVLDPPPGDGRENDEDVGLLLDGDPATAWTSEGYEQRTLANKPGVGLVVRLDPAGRPGTLRVRASNTGWAASVYVGDDAGATLDAWGEPVATQDSLGDSAEFDLGDAEGSYLLLWVTDPGDLGDDGRYRIIVNELSLG
jgi:eukaryotic-like serine/threonine-protein kinase